MALLPDTDRSGMLVGVLAVHPGDLGMCELASGEVVPLAVETLPVKPRRGASIKIDALARRAGPVVALHPLRISAAEGSDDGGDAAVKTEPEVETADIDAPVADDPDGGPQGEFQL
jgi:hypothetical protein